MKLPLDLSDQFVQLLVFVVQDNVNEYLKVNSVEPFVQYFEEGRPKSKGYIYIKFKVLQKVKLVNLQIKDLNCLLYNSHFYFDCILISKTLQSATSFISYHFYSICDF